MDEYQSVSFFDAIATAKTEIIELVEEPESRSKTKIFRLPKAYVVPQAKHRFQAAQIVTAWQRILGIALDQEKTARHLGELERWSNQHGTEELRPDNEEGFLE